MTEPPARISSTDASMCRPISATIRRRLPKIPALISQIHAALLRVSTGRVEAPLEPAKPAVSVKKSMTPDYLVCLEDGKRFKSLKTPSAHAIQHDAGTIPGQMGLPADYPMVAPNYAVARSQLAKKMGLGQQRRRPKIALAGKRMACQWRDFPQR